MVAGARAHCRNGGCPRLGPCHVASHQFHRGFCPWMGLIHQLVHHQAIGVRVLVSGQPHAESGPLRGREPTCLAQPGSAWGAVVQEWPVAVPAPGCTCPTPQLLMGVDFFRAFFPSPPFPMLPPCCGAGQRRTDMVTAGTSSPECLPIPPEHRTCLRRAGSPGPGLSEPFQLSCFSPPFMANFP